MKEVRLLRVELRPGPVTHGVGSVRLDAIVNDREHTITLPIYDTNDFVSRLDLYFDALKKSVSAVL